MREDRRSPLTSHVFTSYRNQKEVAQGIQRAYKELGLKREDIFIVRGSGEMMVTRTC
jgi:hypothetical protein